VTIERLSSNDVTELACDVTGTSMQVAGVLLLKGPTQPDVAQLREILAARVAGVRRLRQRLLVGPLGSGRPVWVDDENFDINQHVAVVRCAAPGDQQAMLAAVALVVTRRLPTGRPLWTATLIDGLLHAQSALVLVFHHALADGIGGLAVLEQLMDGVPTTVDPGFPRRAPRYRELAIDAFRHRMLAVRNIPAGLLSIRRAAAELGADGSSTAPGSSLNRPIGAGRTLAATSVNLDAVKSAARGRGGTVNDVLLTAVAGALHTLLAERGESVERLVISVPVSARQHGAARQLGNQVGVIPMTIPTTGGPNDRLAAVAEITRDRKTHTPGASAALIGPVFRALARLGIFGWFIGHQHRVNTFVTDLVGPTCEVTFAGRRVLNIVAVPMITGNITVAFAALSYAGTLQISILADPGHCPDLPVVLAALRREFACLATADDAAHCDVNTTGAGSSRGW